MGDLLALVAIGVGTYLMRAAFLVTARHRPPAPVARALPHVGPAVLAAITVPALVAPHGTVSLGRDRARAAGRGRRLDGVAAHDEPAHGAVRRARRLVAHLSGAGRRSTGPGT